MRNRNITLRWLVPCLLICFGVISSGCPVRADSTADNIKVTLLKTPNSGIQPQAALDSKGVLHLIYFKGAPTAGDIYYVRSTDGGRTFSAPLRVNSQPRSAIAMGTIRGPQLTIGQRDRVHIAWNGSDAATPKGAGGTPMLYTRLNDAGTAFEPQRSLITWAGGLDGGGTVASDTRGNVYVAWHASAGAQDEAGRAVFLARSTDNGRTFSKEKKINVQPTGACGCCQMCAFVDRTGALYVLYRAAGANVNRDSTLLVSSDKGSTFQSTTLQKWNINACPMSSYSLAQNGTSILASWETNEQVYRAAIAPGTTKFSPPVAAPGNGPNRKHPTIVANAPGEVLWAWTEGTGWNKGGQLSWQVYDAKGQPTTAQGRIDGVPTWSLLSAVARPDRGFLLIY